MIESIKKEKIGVGILTYNRKEDFVNLLNQVRNNKDIDEIVVVKNKNIDYGEIDLSKVTFIHVPGDDGIAYCKNKMFKYLLGANCDHIFTIDDDIKIKNDEVFKKYITTAYAFGIEHLNFCRAFNKKGEAGVPYHMFKYGDNHLEIFKNLNGCFSYFTSNALKTVGLYDERYINCLEHCEHTYRISMAGLYTPFQTFADIADSQNYLEDLGKTSTIIRKDPLYIERIKNALNLFKTKYGFNMNDLTRPDKQKIIRFLQSKMVK